MANSLCPRTANFEASIRQETAEKILYELRSLKATDLLPLAEKKIRNLKKCFKDFNELRIPWQLKNFTIHEVLHICYKLNIDDTDVVADTLQLAYQLSNSDPNLKSERFYFLIWESSQYTMWTSVAFLLGRWRLTNNRSHSRHSQILYYLKHAMKKKLTFDGKRFTEIMCYYSLHLAVMTEEELLIQFLQYGGKFVLRETVSPPENVLGYITWRWISLIILFLRLDGQWDESNFRPTLPLNELSEEVKKRCATFKIFMRSVPNPYVATLEAETEDVALDINNLRNFYEALFPGMGFGYQNPASLKHSCKCVIRDRLNENWQLPFGIQHLGLPRIICNYVNLLQD